MFVFKTIEKKKGKRYRKEEGKGNFKRREVVGKVGGEVGFIQRENCEETKKG